MLLSVVHRPASALIVAKTVSLFSIFLLTSPEAIRWVLVDEGATNSIRMILITQLKLIGMLWILLSAEIWLSPKCPAAFVIHKTSTCLNASPYFQRSWIIWVTSCKTQCSWLLHGSPGRNAVMCRIQSALAGWATTLIMLFSPTVPKMSAKLWNLQSSTISGSSSKTRVTIFLAGNRRFLSVLSHLLTLVNVQKRRIG